VTWSKAEWNDPTDWVIANSPWPATAASGETGPGGAPPLLRLRPEDLGLGLGSPLGRRQPPSPRPDGQAAAVSMEQRHVQGEDESDDVGLHHHRQQQQQQRGNHDSALVVDPLVYNYLLVKYFCVSFLFFLLYVCVYVFFVST